ncbi:MAG: NUDIX hydrolase [Bdellovibrionales bacterium]
MQDYVAGFMFDATQQNVALIRMGEHKPPYLRGRLNAIGGKIENAETPVAAMVREFAEETGVPTTADIWTTRVILTKPGVYRVHFFAASDDAVRHVRSNEKEEVEVFSLQGGDPVHLVPNLQWLIPLCLDPRVDAPVLITEKI